MIRASLSHACIALSLLSLVGCKRGGEEKLQEKASASTATEKGSAQQQAEESADPGVQPAGHSEPLAGSAQEAQCSPGCSSLERCVKDEKGATKCEPACPEGTVFIPPTGPKGFEMGRGAPGSDDQKHTVILTKPFCMDATEVTVAAYKKCVEGGKCTVPQLRDINANYRPEYDRANHPVNMVNYKQAKAYCEAQGESLPTEAQWEYAASHGDGRLYPWGNAPDPTCENGYADFTPGGSPHADPAGDVGCHGGGSSEVKAHPKGKISYPDGDIYDLGGNVWEWTQDCYVPYPRGTVTDPAPDAHPSLKGSCYVYSLRGGGWNRSRFSMHTFSRAASKWTYRVPGLGFRCVKNAD